MDTISEPEPQEPAADRAELGPPEMGRTGTRYVVFEPETGRIVGTYGVIDATTGEYRAQSDDDVRAAFGETPAARGVLGLDVESTPIGSDPARLRVDADAGRLVPRPRLRLDADRI